MSTSTNRIKRYYDSHYRDDEELTQTFFHQAVIEYLIDVLKMLFQAQVVGMATNINFYVTDDEMETGISPDVAVVDGLKIFDRSPDEPGSYFVGEDGPPPRVVFEISSDHTWPTDLGVDKKLPLVKQKPARYAAMGVAEYFAFDPHRPGFWTCEWRQENRLVGWRLNPDGTYSRIVKDEAGRLWSEQLQSWLEVDGQLVRLYDSEGRLRLKEIEDLDQQNEFERQQVAAEQRRADIAQRRAEAEQRRAEAERQRAETLQLQAQAAQRRADEEGRKLAALIERLRAKGIDPDTL